ncbi:putative Nuclear hormone receptor nor-1/nor-2 [Fasciola gigantica]|uniref:Putative Nuclear hormone receptor nor-1/nor-2 n=1 Tax=Fasciola gigantica TaxID=46835 RepID=A0A504Y7P1_FASGI|nr:putative Nuclear hormone receptor nor-1/nor-2 [Fasciola gigantica]
MGLRKPVADLIHMDHRYSDSMNMIGGQRMNSSNSSCTVSSTVTLLSMLTKAYDLVGPSSSVSAAATTTTTVLSSPMSSNNSSSSSSSSKLDVDQIGVTTSSNSTGDADPERVGICTNLDDTPIFHSLRQPRNKSTQFHLNRFCTNLKESMVEIRRYAEMVPGFMSLGTSDREVLLKLHCLDLMTLRLALRSVHPGAFVNLHTMTQAFTDGHSSAPSLTTVGNLTSEESYLPPGGGCGVTNVWPIRDNGTFIEPRPVPVQPTLLGPIPVYRLENGQIFQYDELHQAGVGGWARQLWETGMQIRTLIQGDWSAVAGLAALILVNYKSINYRTPLSKPSDVYSLHHRFVEMLKSHCCSTAQSSQSTTQSLNASYLPRKSSRSPMDCSVLPIGSNRVDSTYFSRVFQQKYLIRSMTRTLLLLPLMQMIESKQLHDPWLKEIIDLMGNSE